MDSKKQISMKFGPNCECFQWWKYTWRRPFCSGLNVLITEEIFINCIHSFLRCWRWKQQSSMTFDLESLVNNTDISIHFRLVNIVVYFLRTQSSISSNLSGICWTQRDDSFQHILHNLRLCMIDRWLDRPPSPAQQNPPGALDCSMVGYVQSRTTASVDRGTVCFLTLPLSGMPMQCLIQGHGQCNGTESMYGVGGVGHHWCRW